MCRDEWSKVDAETSRGLGASAEEADVAATADDDEDNEDNEDDVDDRDAGTPIDPLGTVVAWLALPEPLAAAAAAAAARVLRRVLRSRKDIPLEDKDSCFDALEPCGGKASAEEV
mmetsp:Transcript_18117/g.52930  ORF Transcript_18117/g.52930 Transcript_18117/m.52930 type:complete len:115 (+) Transcript_18117:1792-2136(+)